MKTIGILLIVIIFSFAVNTAGAALVSSTLGSQVGSYTFGSVSGNNDIFAFEFTTGSVTDLENVFIDVSTASGTIGFALYDDSSDLPNAKVVDLVRDSSWGGPYWRFTPQNAASLSANTNYHLVIDPDINSSITIFASNTVNYGTVEFGFERGDNQSGGLLSDPATWSQFDQATTGAYAVNSAIPIPGAAWLLGSGLIFLIGLRRKKNLWD